tara:strand:+ start:382 stop:627 length:246 start_codon:yes stop_codon:yes gene_type:complete
MISEDTIPGSDGELKGILRAIARLKQDIVRIEDCESIDSYVRGPRDIIHERLDGLVQHVDNIHNKDFMSAADRHDRRMGRD